MNPLWMYAAVLILFDIVVFGGTKQVFLGALPHYAIYVCMFLYGMTPYLFYRALSYNSMTIMHLIWNVGADITLTIMGLFYFKEVLTSMQITGALLAITGVALMT